MAVESENQHLRARTQEQEERPLPSQMNDEMLDSKDKLEKILFNLGITEIVLGIFSCGLATVAIYLAMDSAVYSPLSFSAQGIWCGVFLIASGILGVGTKRCPSLCMYNTNMAVSMIAAILMVVLILLSGFAVSGLDVGLLPLLHTVLVAVGCIGVVVTFIHSVFCGGCCCKSRSTNSRHVAYTPQRQGLVVRSPQAVIHHRTQQLVQQPPQQMVLQQPQPLVLQYPHPVVQQQSHQMIHSPPHQPQMVQLANGQFMLVQPLSLMTQEYPMDVTTSSQTPSAPPLEQGTLPLSSADIPIVQSTAGEESYLCDPSDSPPSYDAVAGKGT